jgi:ribonuclease HII
LLAKSLYPDLDLELQLFDRGAVLVAGLDEAGRGALAGPVVAGAVVLPLERSHLQAALPEVRDSKLMTSRQRDLAFDRILDLALAAATGSASSAEIDAVGLIPATRLAMTRALAGLATPPSHLLLDYMLLPEVDVPQTSMPHCDARCLTVSCASVLAKVTRDRVMTDLGRQFPGYGFGRHKGYATVTHRSALAALGPCEAHRRSYAPVAALLPC